MGKKRKRNVIDLPIKARNDLIIIDIGTKHM